MAGPAIIIDNRERWDAFVARVRSADDTYVKIGVTADVAQTEKKVEERAAGKKVKHPTLVQVAFWNEFGTRWKDGSVHVPERSFIRSTHDESRELLGPIKKRLLKRVFEGRLSMAGALKLLGEWMQRAIQRKISSHVPPPNAPSTIRAKNDSTATLIDIGQLRQEIRYEVHAGPGTDGPA